MSDYPEKTCTLDKLVTNPKLVDAVLAGRKVQQRRNGVYGYPGEEFALDGTTFKITALERESLSQMDDAAAQAEGFPSLEAYKNLILRVHPGMTWNDKARVWVHSFEKVA